MYQFNLVSPERRLASVEAKGVGIPGSDGDMTAMAGHVPTLTTLRPGILTVVTEAGETSYIVTGGFAEIGAEGTTVLAEQAVAKENATTEVIEGFLTKLHAAVEIAKDKSSAEKAVADMLAVKEILAV